MGLVMMGTNNGQVIEEMCSYASDTQHEKIIRGLAIGVAMCVYNRLEEADSLIDNLLKDRGSNILRNNYWTAANSNGTYRDEK